MTHYDVVINGAGMAGAVLALSLAGLTRPDGSRLNIAVIEAMRPDHNQHPGFDARSIALAWHSCEQLTRLGIWPALAPLATPITHVQVSDQGHFGRVEMQATEYGVPALGYVIELYPTGCELHRRLTACENITLYCPGRIAGFEQQPEQVNIELDTGVAFSASLLVAADGNRSLIGKQLGIPRRQLDYGQSAIIANISTAEAHAGRAFERFTAQGPLALLPMSEGRSSLVWCESSGRAEQLMAMSDEAFLAALQREFGYRLGKLLRTGKRTCYPLSLDEAPRPWHHRVVLLGNAAHLLHPIAGQGFNLGLRDVTALTDNISHALKAGQDIGSHGVLSHYGRARQADQAGMVGLTTALALLFSNDNPVLSAGRNLGLSAMAACTSLKSQLAWRAMGKR
ncbi:2-octaprenyl-6-methoxyphenyl hydroxylase [Oceanimonas baumannii]|uniref:2-octaprenyl-6-methoxyphenol hydroxylase n=1 Tax=Oceanimonas baumannii TaxID=129578 RepID=A0A235CNC2_9GAMM|nr:2-octaprenyl-6-methoxyphenyl hydroxylase [Oceanimonas baumannii]OYD26078.1 2-octaprenyl-6-methoxyphenyl hydroxylase [Oceanimonas baumannii]TDW62277.1 2-octaprenyl-6-methoxyphenol hydroxylase [Oceanimonas baumannii]